MKAASLALFWSFFFFFVHAIFYDIQALAAGWDLRLPLDILWMRYPAPPATRCNFGSTADPALDCTENHGSQERSSHLNLEKTFLPLVADDTLSLFPDGTFFPSRKPRLRRPGGRQYRLPCTPCRLPLSRSPKSAATRVSCSKTISGRLRRSMLMSRPIPTTSHSLIIPFTTDPVPHATPRISWFSPRSSAIFAFPMPPRPRIWFLSL